MINACVISSKENVAFNMASVVCKSGARCERYSTYSFEKIKSFNIAIIDLDNIVDFEEDIKKTSAGFKDIIVVGISREQAKMDDFSFCMQTIRKPLLLASEWYMQALFAPGYLRSRHVQMQTEPDPLPRPRT